MEAAKTPRPAYSQLRSMKRIDLVQAVPLAGPLAIFLEPTNICNFKCEFCPESFPDYKEKAGGLFQMSLDDFKDIARQIKELDSVKTLNFYMMGEPFGNKHLPEFVRFAKQENIAEKVIVTSNGTLLKPEKYAALCDSGLDYLRVSVYGGNEAMHKQRTGSPIRLSRVRDNVAGLKKYRDENGHASPQIYVKMIKSILPEENAEFLATFRETCDEIMLEPVMNWNDPDEGNLAGQDHETLLGSDYFSKKKEVCPFPFYNLIIHSDLNVSVCCVDWDKKTVVGNLRDSSLAEIWKGERLRHFQMMHLQRRRHELAGCKSCTFLHTAPDNLDALGPEEYAARS